MRLLTIALMTPLLLSGCLTVNSDVVQGLTVIKYSREVQAQAAQEMQSNSCPVLNNFMNDYSVLRDQVRIR